MPIDWGLAPDYAARDVYTEEMPVTEAEWLAATDPTPLLDYLHTTDVNRYAAITKKLKLRK